MRLNTQEMRTYKPAIDHPSGRPMVSKVIVSGSAKDKNSLKKFEFRKFKSPKFQSKKILPLRIGQDLKC
jgi:hypothetical protein